MSRLKPPSISRELRSPEGLRFHEDADAREFLRGLLDIGALLHGRLRLGSPRAGGYVVRYYAEEAEQGERP